MDDFDDEYSEKPRPPERIAELSGDSADTRTLSIDLDNLFTGEVWKTGSFNLKGIESSSLGKLLDALPMPALLVDRRYRIVYVNNPWTQLDDDSASSWGCSFMDLIPCSEDAARTSRIIAQATQALEQAFETRKLTKVEAILRTGSGKTWARLHLRSVRIASRRYLLTIVEDITAERTRERLGLREEQRLKKLCGELQEQVGVLKAQLVKAQPPA